MVSGEAHEVCVMCRCESGADDCLMERYISDVRIAYAEVQFWRDAINMAWQRTRETVLAV
jgi:hypothetical protein